ncbi:MAG: S41 family peptidase [Gemmatimonadales bacterium]
MPFFLALIALLALAGTVPAVAQPDRAVDAASAAATFDTVWSRIKSSHYDTALVGRPWDRARDSLRPAAVAARTRGELRGVLTALLGTLGESHHVIIPEESFVAGADSDGGSAGTLGITVRLVEGVPVVVALDSAGPAERAGVRTGWSLDSIGGRATAPIVAAALALGQSGPAVAATLLTNLATGPTDRDLIVAFGVPGGTRRLAVRPEEPTGTPVQFGTLPPQLVRVWSQRHPTADGCVGVIGFSIWMMPVLPAFDRAVDGFRECRGIVIDLRGNPGGVIGLLMGVAGHFLDRADTLGTMRNRTSTIRIVANPRRVTAAGVLVRPFAGPVAIVVDEMTGSASELFAAGLQALGRARIIGTRTAGQALPAVAARLPSGDALMHVIADFVTPAGRRVEAQGVVPDLPVPLERRALLEGRDRPIESAIAWIVTQPRGVSP